MDIIGNPQQTPKNYKAMSEQGYKANVIGYQAVTKVSQGAARLKWDLFDISGGAEKEIEKHPLLDLLNNPNPMQGRQQFFESYFAFLLLDGNSYVERNMAGKPELWPVRPDYMKVIPGENGMPEAFCFQPKTNGEKVIFEVNQANGQSDLLQSKLFNPTNDWYGMSPIEAALLSLDQHNQAGKWNLSLLQRGAKPSGALVVTSTQYNPTATLPNEVFDKLKAELEMNHTGPNNAAKTMLLQGGLDWKQFSLSPVDMDFLNSKNLSAREICLAYGVPPLLLNISGDNTYNNLSDARLALYDEMIIPISEFAISDFNRWLVPMFGKGLELRLDLDCIEALAPRRKAKFEQANLTSEYLTINERRDMVGYPPIEGGDVLANSSLGSDSEDGTDDSETEDDESESESETENDSSDAGEDGEENDAGDSENEPADDEDAKFHEDILNLEIKQVNVIGLREKQRTAKRLMAKQNAYAFGLEKDVKEILDEMSKEFGKISTNEIRIAEMAVAQIVEKADKELEKVISKYVRRVAKDFGSPILDAGKEFGPDIETKRQSQFDSWLEAFVKKHTAEAIEEISGTTIAKARSKIKRIVQDGIQSGQTNYDIGKELQSQFEGLSASRAKTIARTEVMVAANNGSLEAAKSLGVPNLQKEWVSVQDDRTRDDASVADHKHMNGKRVELNEKFNVQPDTDMTGPGDPSAPPEQVINCRCALVYSRARQ